MTYLNTALDVLALVEAAESDFGINAETADTLEQFLTALPSRLFPTENFALFRYANRGRDMVCIESNDERSMSVRVLIYHNVIAVRLINGLDVYTKETEVTNFPFAEFHEHLRAYNLMLTEIAAEDEAAGYTAKMGW